MTRKDTITITCSGLTIEVKDEDEPPVYPPNETSYAHILEALFQAFRKPSPEPTPDESPAPNA